MELELNREIKLFKKNQIHGLLFTLSGLIKNIAKHNIGKTPNKYIVFKFWSYDTTEERVATNFSIIITKLHDKYKVILDDTMERKYYFCSYNKELQYDIKDCLEVINPFGSGHFLDFSEGRAYAIKDLDDSSIDTFLKLSINTKVINY